MELPILFHKGKTSKIYSWRVWTEADTILTEYGQVDGKKQISSKIAEPKNIGKSNETTPSEQAEAEALSMWKEQQDKKYRLTPEEVEDGVFLPMLADDFEKHHNKIKYLGHLQPKLDGLRLLSSWEGDRVRLMSRGGKDFNLPHIQTELEKLMPKETILDGELFIPGKTFQEITSLVKKWRPGQSEKVEYHIYDCPSSDTKWFDREKNIRTFFETVPVESPLKRVETFEVKNKEEVYSKTAEFVSQGFEGGIVRNFEGLYLFGYRSKDLLKVKSFMDSEYKVVGANSGIGRFLNCVIWVCDVGDGRLFNVVPKGTLEQKAEWLTDSHLYIGQMLKVKYFSLTDEGIPRFPVGIGFRLPEDM